jgi:YidC/Oxa1 family membrane protein insertase
MDNKRFILAIILSVAVIFVMQLFFPGLKPSAKGTRSVADSAAVATRKGTTTDSGRTTATAAPQIAAQTAPDSTTTAAVSHSAAVPPTATITAETTVVSTRRDSGATFTMSNVGAAPTSVVMNAYTLATPANKGNPIDLVIPGQSLIKYQIVTNNKQEIDLSKTPFAEQRNGNVVTYTATVANMPVALQYTFEPSGHTVHVSGRVGNLNNGYLLAALPSTMPVTEHDTMDDYRAFAYAYYSKHDGARAITFHSLDPGEKQLVTGPLSWVAAKTKYFVVGILAPQGGTQFDEMHVVGGARTSKVATRAAASVVIPVKNGQFGFDLYAGPQEWKRLHAQGRSLDEVNPYGWAFLRGVLQPIATSVIRLVIWMHQELHLGYGLVLVMLGVLVRVILWPLNQGAMRTSLKMQELQPKIQEVQTRYKNEPEKQRTEVMKVYTEHGMSPLSPLTGCLPMLLPMPVLFALFFVFQNTIEFRGVSFLWMHDLSSRDPYYILPVVMAVSMYLLSWIGMRSSPSNPQAKMMSYLMPGMFLIFLGREAAGLNLYYAAQNLAALPQQWMITKERAKRQPQQSKQPPPQASKATKKSSQKTS